MMKTGQCLCGAVRFEAETYGTFNICYCKMCQRWSAGAFFGVPTSEMRLTAGADELQVVQTSAWADRAFCRKCGSNIYYKVRDQRGPAVTLGSLDDPSGMTVTKQYFIDKKPEGFTIAEETVEMTEAECIAYFAPDE